MDLRNISLPHDTWTEIFLRTSLKMPGDRYTDAEIREQIHRLALESNMTKTWNIIRERHYKWWTKNIPNGRNIRSYFIRLRWAMEHDYLLIPYRTKSQIKGDIHWGKHPSPVIGKIFANMTDEEYKNYLAEEHRLRWSILTKTQIEIHRGIMEKYGGWERLPLMKHYFLIYLCPACGNLRWGGTRIEDAAKSRKIGCRYCKAIAQKGKGGGEMSVMEYPCPKCHVKRDSSPFKLIKQNGTHYEGSILCSECGTPFFDPIKIRPQPM